jgi:hypothetical protein
MSQENVTVTPHQRRMSELTALRGLIAGCEQHVDSATVPNATIAAIFEQHTSALPDGSKLRAQLENLTGKLRRDPNGVVVGSHLRKVLISLRRNAHNLGKQVEARDAKLRQRG